MPMVDVATDVAPDAARAEYAVLSLFSEDGHLFGATIGGSIMPAENQQAFERLQLRDWIRLIDIKPMAGPGTVLIRLFMAMPDAVAWHRAKRAQGWGP